VDLYWLPLGAGEGNHCVRWSGRTFEAVVAGYEYRKRRDLYHSALEVHVDADRFVIESAPVWGNEEPDRGVVCEGPVGLSWLGRSRFFRYEVRRWRNGEIPDKSESVQSPVRMSTDEARAEHVLKLVPDFPTAAWGRDTLQTGDMWNSNSLISWLLARTGHAVADVAPPLHGRAPGWSAGLVVAERDIQSQACQ
jgi:hypothetical protein